LKRPPGLSGVVDVYERGLLIGHVGCSEAAMRLRGSIILRTVDLPAYSIILLAERNLLLLSHNSMSMMSFAGSDVEGGWKFALTPGLCRRRRRHTWFIWELQKLPSDVCYSFREVLLHVQVACLRLRYRIGGRWKVVKCHAEVL